MEEDTFSDEWVINSETDIDGFIGADVNLSYQYKKPFGKTTVDQFSWYLESTYWKLEQHGLRFYGERMNIFIPYRAISKVKRGWLWCNIILKFDTELTAFPYAALVNGHWTEVCISLGHLPSMRGDRMLRDELYQRIAAAKAVDLMGQLVDVLDGQSSS